MTTVRERFNGHCCAADPQCEHSLLSDLALARHLDSPVLDALPVEGMRNGWKVEAGTATHLLAKVLAGPWLTITGYPGGRDYLAHPTFDEAMVAFPDDVAAAFRSAVPLTES